MSLINSTINSSNAKWFWLRTAIRSPGVISILPRVLSISPERILRKVDLPAPFAPETPYSSADKVFLSLEPIISQHLA